MPFEMTEFDTLLDELRTLPRATLFIDGVTLNVRVYPPDFRGDMKDVAALCDEQESAARIYCAGILDEQEADVEHHNKTCTCGEVLTVDRTFILRRVPEMWLSYA